MDVFVDKKTVSNQDLDQLNHVNNVRYVQWVQNIAEKHWLNKASKDILNTCYWVLIEHTITYKQAAVLGDIVRIETHILSSDGVKSIRQVQFYNDATDVLLASSKTTWCFMDTKTNRPKRITKDIAVLFN